MKLLVKYISVLCYVLFLVSCSFDEHGMGTDASYETVEIIARPTSFFSEDLTTKSDDLDYSDWEKEIHSLYLLIFNNNGERVAFIDDVNLKTLKYKFSFDSQPFSVCALANVPREAAFACNSLSALSSCSFDFDYNTDWTPGIKLNTTTTTTKCLPMYGFKQSTEVNGNSNKLIIDLQSLFAKFTFSLSDGNDYSFAMDSENGAIINKLPKTVYLDENYTPRTPTFTSGNISLSSPTSTVIYVPEYILADKKSVNDSELYKPEGAPDDALYLTLSGIISGKCPSSRIQYKVYLGDNNSTSYSLMRNTYYNNVLTVQGIANALNLTDQRVNYIGHNLADPTCSGTEYEEAANCYIISQPGRYIFPAVKGAGNPTNLGAATGSPSPTSVISDGNNSITNVKRVNAEGKDDDNGAYISFDVASVKDGNSVIPVDDWSWHLWFVSPKDFSIADYDVELDKLENEGGYQNNKIMMNRNLGASSTIGNGLYYQWGNKNPLGYEDEDVAYTGPWGDDSKSVTDPCPPGYRIPSTSVWADKPGGSHYALFTAYAYTESVYYPYAGYYKNSEEFIEEEPVTVPLGDDFSFEALGYTGKTATGTVSVKDSKGKTYKFDIPNIPLPAKDIYTKIDANVHVRSDIGNVWASNGMLHYKYGSLDVSTLSEEALRESVTINSYKKERKEAVSIKNLTAEFNWKTLFGYQIPLGIKSYQVDFNWENVTVTDNSMSDSDKVSFLAELFADGSIINHLESDNIKTISEAEKKHWLPVRCVVE